MKHFLLIAGLLLALGARAQSTTPPQVAQSVHYQYCMLYKSGNTWQLDYGQNAKPVVADASLREANEAVLKLKSEVAALNYLDSRGWEYVNSNSYSGSTYSGRTDYLLRRRLP
jgi:hypothetical protein